MGHPACKLGILGHAVSSQQPKDAEARAGALPLTGSRRFPLLPRVDVPTTRFDIRRKGSEAVKRRTRDVDAGLLASCGCLPASVRCAYVRIGKGSLISLTADRWGDCAAVCVCVCVRGG